MPADNYNVFSVRSQNAMKSKVRELPGSKSKANPIRFYFLVGVTVVLLALSYALMPFRSHRLLRLDDDTNLGNDSVINTRGKSLKGGIVASIPAVTSPNPSVDLDTLRDMMVQIMSVQTALQDQHRLNPFAMTHGALIQQEGAPKAVLPHQIAVPLMIQEALGTNIPGTAIDSLTKTSTQHLSTQDQPAVINNTPPREVISHHSLLELLLND